MNEPVTTTAVPDRNLYPLSFGQERLWFIDRFSPGLSTYNMPVFLRLKGTLDRQVLQRTLQEIVNRHDTLRTTFRIEGNQPVQAISRSMAVDLPETDLSGLPAEERESQLKKLARDECAIPFDLEQGPLFRARLVKLADDDFALLTTRHHITADGWSNGVFLKELGVLYASFLNGKPSPLADLPISYADYASWQREQLAEHGFDADVEYWKERLGGAPSTLELVTDHPRPAVQTFNGSKIPFSLPATTVAKLKSLGRESGTTLFTVLMTAWNLLLHRYTGQEDIIVGTPVSGRNRAELEPLIGFFVNTLPIRTDLSGNPSVRELIDRVKSTTLGAFEHQNVPLEKVVEQLDIERDTSRSPLFQVLLALQNTPRSSFALPGLEAERMVFEVDTSKFDLTMNFRTDREELFGTIEYNTDLFEAVTIERMARHLGALLENVAGNPEARIDEIPFMDTAEKHLVQSEWSTAITDYPRDRLVHELFEMQVRTRPDEIALMYEERLVTYGELNEKSNRLAHYLRERGVGGDEFVCISMVRSVDMVVGLLAILKAGGAYVPLDPDYPEERLEFMLRDAGAKVLITSAELSEKFDPELCEIIRVDTDWESIAGFPDDNPAPVAKPDELAYVIYTSGSTGKPKGTVIPHRGVVRLVCNTNYAKLDETETLLHMASISFDASTFEVWGALLTGGRCALSPDRYPTAARIGELIDHYGVTTAWLTSALFNMVIDEKPDALASLKQLLIGGEALSVSHVRKAEKLLGSTKIINGYGPTENTTFTCCYPISGNLKEGMVSIPIGRPIANTQVYILDAHRNPCPVGVPGELYIGGDGLATGYLNRPELTEEKFVADPFNDRPEARLYRTGDQVRWLPDGSIEFIGRIDQQVKIRGFRIELGEIETVLKKHPEIGDVTVIVREDNPGQKMLVAYYVPTAASVPVDELRNYLKQSLPDYMMPSALVKLDKLPLNANGKVDRRALPQPDRSSFTEVRAYVPPARDAERELVLIWESLLNIRPIGIRDNFFELGGHSLLAVRMFAQIKEKFDKELPLATLFQAPTIEHLADLLEQKQLNGLWSSLVPIQAGGSRSPLFFVHGAGGNVVIFQKLSELLGREQPFYGLQSRGLDGKEQPLETVEEMAGAYIRDIKSVQPVGPYRIGGMCMGGIVAYEMAQQLADHGDKVELLTMIDTANPPLLMAAQSAARNAASLSEKTADHLRQGTLSKVVLRKAGNKSRKLKRIMFRMIRSVINPFIKPERRYYKNVWRANETARNGYHARPYDGRVVAFLAADKGEWAPTDPRWAWNSLVTRGLETYWMPAQHDTLLQEPQVKLLAEQLRQCLDGIEGETGKQGQEE